MILTFEYRLLPSKRQHCALDQLRESQRLLYNAALEERVGAYRHGLRLHYMDQTKSLTEWRRSDPEARLVPVSLQRETLKRLNEAFQGFFRRVRKGAKPGFPRFRGKGRWNSFGFREFEGISFDGKRLRFKGMPGALKVHVHRTLPIEARILSCNFRRDTKGWKIGLTVHTPDAPARKGDRGCVGLDLGITTFAVLSDGGFIPSLKAARRAERRLRVKQRSLSRKQARSRRRSKASLVVARCHAAIARARSDHLHQASARLIRDYDVIAVEALNIRGLARSPLARDVHDASWAKFISMVKYKAEKAGARLIKVNPKNTSQDCSGCGMRVSKDLNQRLHECPRCGLSIDRDLNAARNILDRAGVGPGLLNVGDGAKRAGGKLVLC